ncbi:MAG: phosphoenolpyruvate--protein phosphotransferase [Bacteroidetes bacterium]|jgi:phosphocarrier protein FPr|nr:phosphoenolpyruvate--protein phosphotransferase [Bacteroidota bacterium]
MVSLVLVSHSRPLARGVVHLIRQMASDEVRVEVAAGTGDDDEELGTDAMAVLEAIQAAMSDDGVLVLVDVGSALLSAETALEFLDEADRDRVRLCPAPFVEGALSGIVQAGLDSDLDAVYTEAVMALAQKYDHLDLEPPAAVATSPAGDAASEGPTAEAVVTVRNPHGLHARPAAQFVQAAGRFQATITAQNRTTGKGPVSAKSISAVATLGAVQDHEVELVARGPDAEAAVRTLQDLIASGFGETEEEAPAEPKEAAVSEATDEDVPEGALRGVVVSEGYAVAPAAHLRVVRPEIPDVPSADPDADWQRLQDALARVREELTDEQQRMTRTVGAGQAAMLEAQRLLLDDPDVLAAARERLFDGGVHVARAWIDAVEDVADSYRALDDAYLRERAADVLDVGWRLVRTLLGETGPALDLPESPSVVITDDLAPSHVGALDPEVVQGVVCAEGSTLSHSAILLRSLGVPAVFGAGPAVLDVDDGTVVGVDGQEGLVWPGPPEDVQERLTERRQQWITRQERLRADADAPAVTTDGVAIEVAANVGLPADAQRAAEQGADGVGLLRTEVLFGDRQEAPTEDEQVDALTAVAAALDGRPVIVRTLDVGGDKPLPFLQLPDPEANPFLGVRGVRLLLRHPDLFQTHCRAILRAAHAHPLKVMFPMVTTLDDLEQARAILDDAQAALDADGIPHGGPLEVGIMIETPASALQAAQLAHHVDFFSIGTNDLTQYVMAADRGNAALAPLADALHPAVLAAIARVTEAAREHGIWVGVCGEVAADPLAAPVLVGLGVTELSVRASAVPLVKALVRMLSSDTCQTLADAVLRCPDAAAVRARSRALLADTAPDLLPADTLDTT